METSLHKLYLYDDVRRLLFVDDKIICLETDNAPMNKHPLKVHKGIDNHLKFRVFDPDRKPVKLFHEVYARLVSCTSRETVLEKKCRLGTATGMLFLDIDEGDIKDKSPGLYEMIIIRSKEFVVGQPDEYIFDPFFTDFDGNIVATVEITEQGQQEPMPSIVISQDDWTYSTHLGFSTTVYCGPRPAHSSSPSNTGAPTKFGYSRAIPGGRVRNHINGTHTFSVYAEGFTGTLEIMGTLEETPNADMESNSWFIINPSSLNDYIKFINFTGTEAFFFKGNFMWLRFRLTPDENILENGQLKKIIVR